LKTLNIAEFNTCSLKTINDYLGVRTKIEPSSKIYQNSHLKGQDRIVDICKKEEAKVYFNPIGGKELYSKEFFRKEGIDLLFLKAKIVPYKQYKEDFVSGLSIIDILMFCDKVSILKMLNEYELL
jgi:hypothetical protein